MNSVGVVIPTVGRQSVLRAVGSVLAQTVPARSVIVVFDGDIDDPGSDVLQGLPNEVQVVFTGKKTNGNFARNLGVSKLSTDLVAFLDDDDVWYVEKLERQLRSVPPSDMEWLQTTSVRVVAESSNVELDLWPGRGPERGESLGDYFFARERLRQTPRFLQTSTWLAPRQLFEAHPFDERLSIHQDWDWIVRAQSQHGVRVIHLSEPLVSYTRNLSASTSAEPRFNESRDWALAPDLPISSRARGDFIVHMLLTRGLREGLYEEARALPRLARSVGSPSFWGLAGAAVRLSLYKIRTFRTGHD